MTKVERPIEPGTRGLNSVLRICVCGVVSALLLVTAAPASAQRLTGTENGEWRYLGGDAGHTRS